MLLGELDLHLFNEGRHWRLWDLLGAHRRSDGSCLFSVWAPNARSVRVVGDWNDWDGRVNPLEPQGSSGIWAAAVADIALGARYKFEIEDANGQLQLKADPMAQATEPPPASASVVTSSDYTWSDDSWMATRRQTGPLRIYEVHLASWRPGTPTRELAVQLADHVADLGFTHVELLPVMEHPFGGSWGYQVTGYFAPTARLGVPDDLRFLIDTLHQRGIGVILDWVPAHFPKDSWALAHFDGTALYEHSDPRQGEHPDWGTLVFNYGRTEVREFLIANALYWLQEFHVDGLRVDAVASMLYLDYSRNPGEWIPNRYGGRENLEAIEFLRQLNTVVGAEHPEALMIAEESTAWPAVTAPVDVGGLGFSHKWNMGWMHDTLAYLSRDPIHRQFHHRELTFGLLYAHTERFVLPLSHDEVVHGKGSLLGKMSGDRWQQLANLRSLYGWMWAYPGAPLLFMGCELAQPHEWSAEWGVEWYLRDHAEHAGVRNLVRALNRAAEQCPAAWVRDRDHLGFQWLDADDATHSVYAFIRWGENGDALVCVANLTPVPRPGYRVGLPGDGEWSVLVNTDGVGFGGSGSGSEGSVYGDRVAWQNQACSAIVDLPPLGVIWLGRKG
ncbi:MAG: 1,4-alpha-glucan branching protein GlgB [Acidimicrobiia bacterium]